MRVTLRILAVIAVAAFVGDTAFLVHCWIRYGFDFPRDFLDVYLFTLLVSAVASIVLVPALLLVRWLAPARMRAGLVLAICILGGALFATLALTQWKQFSLDLPQLVGRAWNVYMYFGAFGFAYGVAWILLVLDSRNEPPSAPVGA